MRRKSSVLFLAVITVVIFLLITGCASQEEGGSLLLDLSFSDSISQKVSKTILPDINMEVNSYSIILNGPNGEVEEAQADSSGIITIENLYQGDWTITATARNISDGDIGTGQGTVTIIARQTASCEIEVIPYTGNGTVDLALSWDTESVDVPSVIVNLISPLGAVVDNVTLENGDNLYVNNNISAGYYTLKILLQDGVEERGGGADVIRVISGAVTQASVYIITSSVEGGAGITIISDLNDPIEINLTGSEVSIVEGTTFTVTAEAVNASDVIYTWYIDGTEMISGASEDQYTVPSDLPVDTHRLDVTIFTSDGLRGGSATHIFDVVGL